MRKKIKTGRAGTDGKRIKAYIFQGASETLERWFSQRGWGTKLQTMEKIARWNPGQVWGAGEFKKKRAGRKSRP